MTSPVDYQEKGWGSGLVSLSLVHTMVSGVSHGYHRCDPKGKGSFAPAELEMYPVWVCYKGAWNP